MALRASQPVAIPLQPSSWSGPSGAAGTILPVPFLSQLPQQNWCWAACAAMVLRYYGATVAPCELANQVFRRSSCCSNPSSRACDKELSDGKITRLYQNQGLQRPDYTTSSISAGDLTAELQGGRPVELGWTLLGGGGHAVLVVGWSPMSPETFFRVHDPGLSAPGNMVYARLVGADGNGHWDATWSNLRQ